MQRNNRGVGVAECEGLPLYLRYYGAKLQDRSRVLARESEVVEAAVLASIIPLGVYLERVLQVINVICSEKDSYITCDIAGNCTCTPSISLGWLGA